MHLYWAHITVLLFVHRRESLHGHRAGPGQCVWDVVAAGPQGQSCSTGLLRGAALKSRGGGAGKSGAGPSMKRPSCNVWAFSARYS